MQNFIDSLLGREVLAPTIFSADVVALNMVVTFVLAVIIALTYKKIHKGISYSQSYVFSIVMVSMIVALAMMVIGNDITRAFALLGTFTIIRYRTAVKDPKDTAFIFASLVVGLAVGSSNYGIAVSGTLILSVAALLLDTTNFGAATKTEQILYLTASLKKLDQVDLEKHMHNSLASSTLLNVNYQEDGQQLLYSYNIQLNKNQSAEELIKKLVEVKGVESAEILSSQNLVEF